MTVGACETFCFVTNNYAMAGLEYGGECCESSSLVKVFLHVCQWKC